MKINITSIYIFGKYLPQSVQKKEHVQFWIIATILSSKQYQSTSQINIKGYSKQNILKYYKNEINSADSVDVDAA